MFDRKDISAVEARGIVAGVNWDDFVNNKIKQCNTQIRDTAEHGQREVHVDIWTKERYVWDKVTQHFLDNGFEVAREWCGISIKW